MKVLIIDNYDSFTYNLVHLVQSILNKKVDVIRNDKLNIEDISKYDKIILSPGPGVPDEAGMLKEVIKKYAPTKSILGVCLGVQAIAEVFGANLINLKEVYHGLATEIQVTSNEKMFKNVSEKFFAGRYHSWIVDKENLPECLEVTATDSEGSIMALSHKTFDVRGVQFHPESVLTVNGDQIIKNWLFSNEKPEISLPSVDSKEFELCGVSSNC
jgi:anthranilate synthase component 2